ncbi:hypothetical protein FQA39_LY12148 [Lamprigera yunnana]|nr:hypothetical protein FQA39_LY12148 [Lamprigera yunnana]
MLGRSKINNWCIELKNKNGSKLAVGITSSRANIKRQLRGMEIYDADWTALITISDSFLVKIVWVKWWTEASELRLPGSLVWFGGERSELLYGFGKIYRERELTKKPPFTPPGHPVMLIGILGVIKLRIITHQRPLFTVHNNSEQRWCLFISVDN